MRHVDWHYIVLYGAYLYVIALTAVSTLGYYSNLYLPPAALFNYYPVGVQAGLMLASYEQKDGALLTLGIFFALLGIFLNGCYLNTVIQTPNYQENSFKGDYLYTPNGPLHLDTNNLYNETAKTAGYQVANWAFSGTNIGLEIMWSIWSILKILEWRKSQEGVLEMSLVCDQRASKLRVAISYICIITSIGIGATHTIVGLILYNNSVLLLSPFQNQYTWLYCVLAWGIYPPTGFLIRTPPTHQEGVRWSLMTPGALVLTWLIGLLFSGVWGGVTLGSTGHWRYQNHMNLFCPNTTTFPQELVYFPHLVQADELTLQIVTLNGPPPLLQQMTDFSCMDDILGFLLVTMCLLVFIMAGVLYGYHDLSKLGGMVYKTHMLREQKRQHMEYIRDNQEVNELISHERGIRGRPVPFMGLKRERRPIFFRAN